MTVRTWGATEREWLKRTREVTGHSQGELAQFLHDEYHAAKVDQSTVSGWEVRTRPSDEHLEALHAYCERFGSGLEPPAASTASPPPPGATADDDASAFEEVVRGITEEPLLGETQRELIRAVLQRVANGPPMSPEDERALGATAVTLRVPEGVWRTLTHRAS